MFGNGQINPEDNPNYLVYKKVRVQTFVNIKTMASIQCLLGLNGPYDKQRVSMAYHQCDFYPSQHAPLKNQRNVRHIVAWSKIFLNWFQRVCGFLIYQNLGLQQFKEIWSIEPTII